MFIQDGLTPLMFAANLGQLNLVRLLVENGRAKLNIFENVSLQSCMDTALNSF